ncbi:MAG: cupin domain-containing protein [Actinomycetota bacterium]|nr:cupin domain-containing protein [Actinomycetota bacterium]
MRKLRRIAGIAVCAVGLGVLPTAAQATPASGVAATVLAHGTTDDGFSLTTSGPSEFVVRHITIQPGGSTGWHYHPGTLLAVVQRGSLIRIDDNCRAMVYVAGQSLVEPSGPRHVHIGRNLGTEPVELYVTYVNPIGSPLSVDAADPQCEAPHETQ